MMRVRVDPDRCQGHGRCYATAPDLFVPDDLGNSHEAGDGSVPAGLEDLARLAVVYSRPPAVLAPERAAPPISSDPPFHKEARRLLLPIFSPQAVEKLEPSTRAYCEELVDALRGRDVVDAAEDYAQHIPVRV